MLGGLGANMYDGSPPKKFKNMVYILMRLCLEKFPKINIVLYKKIFM